MGSLSKKLQNLKKELQKADEMAEKFLKNDNYASLFFTVSSEALSITGTDGYFKLVNNPWLEMLKYKPEEVINKSWLDFIHPDDVEKTIDFANRVRSEAGAHECFENRYRNKDGEYVTLSWNSKQIPDGTIFSTIKIVK